MIQNIKLFFWAIPAHLTLAFAFFGMFLRFLPDYWGYFKNRERKVKVKEDRKLTGDLKLFCLLAVIFILVFIEKVFGLRK